MICQIISRLRKSGNIISFRPAFSLHVIFQFIQVSWAFYTIHTNFSIIHQMWELPDLRKPPEESLKCSGHWWGFSGFWSARCVSLLAVSEEKRYHERYWKITRECIFTILIRIWLKFKKKVSSQMKLFLRCYKIKLCNRILGKPGT